LSPHPSIEGRGLYLGGFMWLGANGSGEGKGSGGRARDLISTVRAVDGGFKLHLPSKIVFDMNAG
jgi:hypothetical protein